MAAANRKRPTSWSIRMTDSELAAVKKRVKESGLTQRDFAMHALLSVPILNIVGINSILPELRRIGNNINQIAYYCNKDKANKATYEEILMVRKELNQVWQSLKQLAARHH